MPIHDWTRVDAGIFHDFHHAWIEEIKRVLNSGLLPGDYYALAERQTGPFGPDVLALQTTQATEKGSDDTSGNGASGSAASGSVLLAAPKIQLTAEAEIDFYSRKQSTVVIRHVSDDHIIAMVEIVSRGNKSSQAAVRAIVDKAIGLLWRGIHLVLIDLQPIGPRDPAGIHGLIWSEFTGQTVTPPIKPLSAVAYEAGIAGRTTRAYLQPITVGEPLPDMPLFLQAGAHVELPLNKTYDRAYAALPKRWRQVLDS